jgi:hypothetical protein
VRDYAHEKPKSRVVVMSMQSISCKKIVVIILWLKYYIIFTVLSTEPSLSSILT